MCALCGLLGATHWTEISAHREAFTQPSAPTLRHERERRARFASAILAPLRVKVSDWQGSSYKVASATGRNEVVDDIQSVWMAVERIRGSPVDPLDDGYIGSLAGAPP